MGEAMRFRIGAAATCSDGPSGELRRIVIDPATRAVTHLVVEAKDRQGLGRLVPLDLVDASLDGIRLRCTTEEFGRLDHAEETEFLPASGGHADYPAGEPLPQPYRGLDGVIGDVPQPVTYDTIPVGDVEVKRGEQVRATDGVVGNVQGLVIDGQDHLVTGVIVHAHVWGRKEVAIPIGAVAAVDSGIQLSITKEEVRELPTLEVGRPPD